MKNENGATPETDTRKTAFPYKMVSLMVVLTIFLCGEIAWHVWDSYREIRESHPRTLRIQQLQGVITHLDEVLTMSARMWAVTGEDRWELRYREHEMQLDAAIKEIRQLAPNSYATAAATRTDDANQVLVEMEHRAFSLGHQGKSHEAIALLLGKEYEQQKQIYAEGMQLVSAQLQQDASASYAQLRQETFSTTWLIGGVMALLFLLWSVALNMVRRHLGERKKAEAAFARASRELLAKEEENKTFLHGVSHDLRSPVTGILGFLAEFDYTREEVSQILLGPPSADSQKRCLNLVNDQMAEMIRFIRASTERLNHLLEALLRLSRTGKIESQPVAVDINPIIRRIVDSLQGTIDKTGTKIIAAELPAALGDPTTIEQIFANLIGNALKYLDPNRPSVIEIGCQVEQNKPSGNAGMHCYFVKDNGLGIPAHAMPKLFQVFQRFHPAVAPGEGVGLTIVRRAVERQGGKVWCESAEGAGSTFFVELPAT